MFNKTVVVLVLCAAFSTVFYLQSVKAGGSLMQCSGAVCSVSYSGANRAILRVPDGKNMISVVYSGSGVLSILGDVKNLNVVYSGSSILDLSGLNAVDVHVVYSGSGPLQLRASGQVTGTASGSGVINVVGGGKMLIRNSGSGTISASQASVQG